MKATDRGVRHLGRSDMAPSRDQAKDQLPAKRQPLLKTLRGILLRLWVKGLMPLSAISPLFTRLATLPFGPYKDKRRVLNYLGERFYVSPNAQVKCPNLHLSPHCFVDDYVTIYAHPQARGGIYLDRNVHIYRWSMIELGKGEGSLRIGHDTYIQSGCVFNVFVGNIIIGAACLIAPGCAFTPYQHGFADVERLMHKQPLTSRGDIVIEDNVWLGLHVCVMDGVTIGRGAIVGAGAVVTQDIPPYAIAAGVPARVIRSRQPGESVESALAANMARGEKL